MVQFSIVTGGSLPVLESAVAGAARFAEAVRSIPNARAVSAQAGGIAVANDRQHVAASGRLAGEVNARSAGTRNATSAVSLLQTVEDALVEIGSRLDQMETLAEAAGSDDRSDQERAQFDVEFQAIKAEIDTIVEQTTFNGAPLLQGGDGPGGILEISVKVGSGNEADDTITVSIAPAAVADLSSALDSRDIQSQADALTAIDDVTTAQDALNTIRAGVSGDIQRFFAAARSNQAMISGLEDTQAVLSSPTVSVDMAQILAAKVAEEGGIRLADYAVERLQQLLMGLERPAGAEADEQKTGSMSDSDKPASAPSPAGYRATSETA